MTVYLYHLVRIDDSQEEIDALTANAEALGLGKMRQLRDTEHGARRMRGPFRKRHAGGRIFVRARPGDTVICPEYGRAFSAIGDFAANAKRWALGNVRLIVIDIGFDSASEFGRQLAAVLDHMLAVKHRKKLLVEQARKAARSPGESLILGTVRRGARHRRHISVDPTLYELGLKCREWMALGWTPKEIETHLWKMRIYRVQKRGGRSRPLPVSELRNEAFAKKWTWRSIQTLVANLDKIDEGVLSGKYRLPKDWRPASGPLSKLPVGTYEQKVGGELVSDRSAWMIGRKLRELRLELGLSQRQLATISGICQPQIADAERGAHHPKLSTLVKLAEALKVPVTTFDIQPALPAVVESA